MGACDRERFQEEPPLWAAATMRQAWVGASQRSCHWSGSNAGGSVLAWSSGRRRRGDPLSRQRSRSLDHGDDAPDRRRRPCRPKRAPGARSRRGPRMTLDTTRAHCGLMRRRGPPSNEHRLLLAKHGTYGGTRTTRGGGVDDRRRSGISSLDVQRPRAAAYFGLGDRVTSVSPPRHRPRRARRASTGARRRRSTIRAQSPSWGRCAPLPQPDPVSVQVAQTTPVPSTMMSGRLPMLTPYASQMA